MHIRVGYDLIYHCPQGTPMLLIVNIHYSRASDLVMPDYLTTDPSVPGIHLRRDTLILQWFQTSKTAAASDGHAVHF
jgi:hypothetical protein